MQPAAVRQRRRRQKLVQKIAAQRGIVTLEPDRMQPVTRDVAPPASTGSTYETVPVTGPGPDKFQWTPIVTVTEEHEHNGTSTFEKPFVENPPTPAAPVTEGECAAVALLVSQFFAFGAAQMLVKRPTIGAAVSRLAPLEVTLAKGSKYVYDSTVRTMIKHGVRLEYADEITVAGAITVGVLGVVMKPEKGARVTFVPSNDNVDESVTRDRHAESPPVTRVTDDDGDQRSDKGGEMDGSFVADLVEGVS